MMSVVCTKNEVNAKRKGPTYNCLDLPYNAISVEPVKVLACLDRPPPQLFRIHYHDAFDSFRHDDAAVLIMLCFYFYQWNNYSDITLLLYPNFSRTHCMSYSDLAKDR